MKHRSIATTFLSLAIISSGILPFHANAQNYYNGEIIGQEEYYNWLQSDNRTLRKRVDQLDEDPVASLPMPILFGVTPANLSPNFGDPRSGGRAHEGEDIMAPKGAPIISPTEAVVLSTGVWEGGGKYVSTANPGGEKFVYMHLDWIADLDPGDILDPGDLIGYVGNTGNASGGAAHLHLEIRKNGAKDPFPRLKSEFTLAQKMKFIKNIIDDGQSRDEDKFVQFLLGNYRSQFLAAQALGIDLPSEIEKEIGRTPTLGTTAIAVPSFPGDLTLGSTGSAVVTLQNFLITQNIGLAARALANAKATGYFGSITKAALSEYQTKTGISPAAGYFGPTTRARITAALKA